MLEKVQTTQFRKPCNTFTFHSSTYGSITGHDTSFTFVIWIVIEPPKLRWKGAIYNVSPDAVKRFVYVFQT